MDDADDDISFDPDGRALLHQTRRTTYVVLQWAVGSTKTKKEETIVPLPQSCSIILVECYPTGRHAGRQAADAFLLVLLPLHILRVCTK